MATRPSTCSTCAPGVNRHIRWSPSPVVPAPPRSPSTGDCAAAQARQLAAAVYGFAGPAVLRRQLDLLLAGRRGLWSVLGGGARFVFERKAPYRHEPDLVGRIGYRELNYAAAPDGKPLDPAIAFG